MDCHSRSRNVSNKEGSINHTAKQGEPHRKQVAQKEQIEARRGGFERIVAPSPPLLLGQKKYRRHARRLRLLQ